MKKSKKKGIQTFLGEETTMQGKLTFQGTCQLNGRFKGSVESQEGNIVVGDKAIVQADISVRTATVYGEVTGNIRAETRIELHPPARVFGDLNAPEVLVDVGVVFDGKCKTISEEDSAAKTVELKA